MPWCKDDDKLGHMGNTRTKWEPKDALAGLQGSGLVHLQGALVIPSRAARRMDELSL